MRRVGFAGVSALFCIVFLLLSCDINPMDTEIERGVVADPENEDLQYLTVTYHSEGHTSGEVPVDPARYPVPRFDGLTPPSFIVRPETAIILGQGTLKKEGYEFRGWTPRHIDVSHFQPEHEIDVWVNIDFDAEWWPLPPPAPEYGWQLQQHGLTSCHFSPQAAHTTYEGG